MRIACYEGLLPAPADSNGSGCRCAGTSAWEDAIWIEPTAWRGLLPSSPTGDDLGAVTRAETRQERTLAWLQKADVCSSAEELAPRTVSRAVCSGRADRLVSRFRSTAIPESPKA